MRKTKVICTIGPACEDGQQIQMPGRHYWNDYSKKRMEKTELKLGGDSGAL